MDIAKKPRRRVLFEATIEADSWRDLKHHLIHLATEIAADGRLSASSVSGGYSTGHIISTHEDESITHESWAADLEEHLAAEQAKDRAKP